MACHAALHSARECGRVRIRHTRNASTASTSDSASTPVSTCAAQQVATHQSGERVNRTSPRVVVVFW